MDPHPPLLASWGLDDDADGLAAFADACLAAFAGQVSTVKPQSAFFERHGAAGIAVLERFLAGLAGSGTLVRAGRQARRHRLDDGRLRGRLPARTAPRSGRTP